MWFPGDPRFKFTKEGEGPEKDWWFPVQQTETRVKFTKEGEEKLFGESSDDSELQLPNALQFASHLTLKGDFFSPSPAKLRSMLGRMLETFNNPFPSLEHLRWLTFSGTFHGGRWVKYANPVLHAINSKKLSKLISLEMSNARLMVEDLPSAIKSECIPFLKDLALMGIVEHLALASVMKAGHLPLLQTLLLVECNGHEMSSTECQAYATAFSLGKLPSLTCINFSFNVTIGNKGVKALAHTMQSGGLKNLAHLHLHGCGIQDDGLIAIADSFRAALGSSVMNLRTLDLDYNNFGDVGLLSLADVLKIGHLNSLQYLGLLSNYASRTGASALVLAFWFNMHLNVDLLFDSQNFPDLERRKDQFIERNSRYRDILAGLVVSPVVRATFGKVYLCGNPEVGKTTLHQSLQRSLLKSLLTWERRPHVEDRTRGIDVTKFSMKGKKPGESPIKLFFRPTALPRLG